jgi:hypothetical protein
MDDSYTRQLERRLFVSFCSSDSEKVGADALLQWGNKNGAGKLDTSGTAVMLVRKFCADDPARQLEWISQASLVDLATLVAEREKPPVPEQHIPHWDSTRGILTIDGEVAREVAPQAFRIRAILDAFEAQGWIYRINDPFSDGDDTRLNAIGDFNKFSRIIKLRSKLGTQIEWYIEPTAEPTIEPTKHTAERP